MNQVQHQKPAHAVITETLPHLHEKQQIKPQRMAKKSPIRAGDSSLIIKGLSGHAGIQSNSKNTNTKTHQENTKAHEEEGEMIRSIEFCNTSCSLYLLMRRPVTLLHCPFFFF